MMLAYLIQKEFIQILRNKFVPRLILIFPVIIVCVAPWIMTMEVKDIAVDVVDADRSTASQRLVERIAASNYFLFNRQHDSYADATEDIRHGKADIIMEIPPHYERDLMESLTTDGTVTAPSILIAANAANAQKGSMGAAYLSQIVMQARQEQMAHMGKGSRLGNTDRVSVLNLYNRELSYKLFMIPALIGLLLMMLCGFLPAMNIVSEKESGTIEQINVTPVPKSAFIFAKLFPYWLIGLVVVTLSLLLSWAVYGIVSEGSLALVYLLAMLLALVFSGLGLIISNYSHTMQQAMLLMWFFVVLMLLLSGMFTPIRSMPDWIQDIVQYNPMALFVSAIRTVFIRGGSMESIWQQVLRLAVITLLLDGWAAWSYRKNR